MRWKYNLQGHQQNAGRRNYKEIIKYYKDFKKKYFTTLKKIFK